MLVVEFKSYFFCICHLILMPYLARLACVWYHLSWFHLTKWLCFVCCLIKSSYSNLYANSFFTNTFYFISQNHPILKIWSFQMQHVCRKMQSALATNWWKMIRCHFASQSLGFPSDCTHKNPWKQFKDIRFKQHTCKWLDYPLKYQLHIYIYILTTIHFYHWCNESLLHLTIPTNWQEPRMLSEIFTQINTNFWRQSHSTGFGLPFRNKFEICTGFLLKNNPSKICSDTKPYHKSMDDFSVFKTDHTRDI